MVERLKDNGILFSWLVVCRVDDHIGSSVAVVEGDKIELFTIFLAKVDGEDVALGVLGSDVLDLHGVRLACRDLDPGLW